VLGVCNNHSSSKAVGKEEGEDAVVADEREVVTVEVDPDHGSHIWMGRRRRRRRRRRHMLDCRPIADRNAPPAVFNSAICSLGNR
jgi:hypothetical protein